MRKDVRTKRTIALGTFSVCGFKDNTKKNDNDGDHPKGNQVNLMLCELHSQNFKIQFGPSPERRSISYSVYLKK